MGEDIEARLRERPENNPEIARMDISGRLVVAIKRLMNAYRLQDEAADTIARLRVDLRAALAVLQELVNYDNGGSGDGGAILGAAEQTLASHKEIG